MTLTDNQREALISELGQPQLRLEFDVWGEDKVSMWTHFDHAGDYQEMKKRLVAIRDHLNGFLKDERMCPFHKHENQ